MAWQLRTLPCNRITVCCLVNTGTSIKSECPESLSTSLFRFLCKGNQVFLPISTHTHTHTHPPSWIYIQLLPISVNCKRNSMDKTLTDSPNSSEQAHPLHRMRCRGLQGEKGMWFLCLYFFKINYNDAFGKNVNLECVKPYCNKQYYLGLFIA